MVEKPPVVKRRDFSIHSSLIGTVVNSDKSLFEKLGSLDTEQNNPVSSGIDTATPLEIARIMNVEDAGVAVAVSKKLNEVAEGITLITNAFKNGGRLIYAGSGTSGRIGVVDASECPPTFGTPFDMVIGLIAGGPEAMFRAKEGAEDKPELGAEDIFTKKAGPNDVICGLAASGRTPYVTGALQKAKELGSKTIFVCCVDESQLDMDLQPDVLISVPVGPEVISGSTRLKSGTAQKMVCNMLTTGAMIQLGKVYQNVMVDLQLTNQKLHERAKRIVMQLVGINYEEASKVLEKAGNHVKSALLMAIGKIDYDEAQRILQQHDGFVQKALSSIENLK